MAALGYLVLAVVSVTVVDSYGGYRDRIPNGHKVPNPCQPGQIWNGVGHLIPGGRGLRNQFGIDFAANNYEWSKVCSLDSDGDGLTNGQELGDPTCVWTPGANLDQTLGLSHPGFCDPVDHPNCLNSPHKVSCNNELDCPAISQPGVQSRVLQYTRTTVPNKETNYFCMTFDLDQSQDYHLIATEPLIDNANIMHHILLYGCKDNPKRISSPEECGMGSADCDDVIGGWTLGSTGECLSDAAGFRIGKTGYKTVLLEFHWNNPELRSDYTDASGLKIYFTPNLRQYDAGTFWTGQTFFEIPPGRDRVVVESTCPSECTRNMLNGSIFFTVGTNHMHYRGVAMSVQRISPNGEKMYLTNEPDFSYDSPTWTRYNPPAEIKPGDELKTTCVFQSKKDKKTTFFGEGTADEMCFGFFTYYPKSAALMDRCYSWGSYHQCKRYNQFYGDCNVGIMFNASHPETKMLMDKVFDSCNTIGSCLQECPFAIGEALRHSCLRGGNDEWVLRSMSGSADARLVKFAAAMRSCSCEDGGHVTWPTASSSSSSVSASLFITAAVFMSRIFLT